MRTRLVLQATRRAQRRTARLACVAARITSTQKARTARSFQRRAMVGSNGVFAVWHWDGTVAERGMEQRRAVLTRRFCT